MNKNKNSEHIYSAFLSHSSLDIDKATEICNRLEQKGLRCWIGPRDVRAGHTYPAEIMLGILNSKCLVLVLSDEANESEIVIREVERAANYGKPIFSVRVEKVLPSRSLELFVSSPHWIDAWAGDLIQHVDRLAKNITDKSNLEDAVSYIKPVSPQRSTIIWTFLTVAVVSALIVIVMIVNKPTPVIMKHNTGTAVKKDNYYTSILKKFGGKLSDISKDDIEMSIKMSSDRGHTVKIVFSGKNELKVLLKQTPVEFKSSSGKWIKSRSMTQIGISAYNLEILKLLETGKIIVRFDTAYIASIIGHGGYIGSFTFKFDYAESVREAYKKRALKSEYWLKKGRKGAMLLKILGDIYPAVKEVRLGRAKNTMNSVITIKNQPPIFNLGAIERYSRSSYALPDNLGKSERVYIQLMFYDGSQSNIRVFKSKDVY